MNYSAIDGEQRAASFAYYAFFSLFPLILLLTTAGSLFFAKADVQRNVLSMVEAYMPLSSSDQVGVMAAIEGFIRQRGSASLVALMGIAWTSLRFFHALVRAVNRAWGTVEYSWWRLPIKNLLMVLIMAGVLVVGVLLPPLLKGVEAYVQRFNVPLPSGFTVWLFAAGRQLVPVVVLFLGLLLFYKTAPRAHPAFRYVWAPALIVSLLLQALQWGFLAYAKNFMNFNVIYGAFGGAIALLMWIYLSGSVIIFGGCLSAAIAQVEGKSAVEASDET